MRGALRVSFILISMITLELCLGCIAFHSEDVKMVYLLGVQYLVHRCDVHHPWEKINRVGGMTSR